MANCFVLFLKVAIPSLGLQLFSSFSSVRIMDSHNEDHDMSMGERNDACRCDCQHDLDMNVVSKFQMFGGFNVVLTVVAQEP